MDTESLLHKIRGHLEHAGVSPEASAAFERMYRRFRGGEAGLIPWDEVSTLEAGDLVGLDQVCDPVAVEAGRRRLPEVAWIVLNGGLGTSMRMDRAKSLVPIKGADTFLDLLCRHVLSLRARWGVQVPLVFMNSFATRDDTLAALAAHDVCVKGKAGELLPVDFVQNRFPRIQEGDGLPYGGAEDRSSWAPPGHGDLFLALHASGTLRALRRAGIRWAFVSNADNLGASIHLGILGFLAERGYEFLMEVTKKTAADVKGGTLIRRHGRLTLLELAQVPRGHQEDFQDVERFPVFNTNSLWLDLEAVETGVESGKLDLPLILNRKTVDGAAVVQFETAMGAAVGAFDRTAGILVPRSRFAPVKTTDDLLVRRSDVYVPGDESPLVPNPARDASLGPPVVRLDPRYFGSVEDLTLRIPDPPSLVRSSRLEIEGDVRFGSGVTVIGEVRLRNGAADPMYVRDGESLGG